MNNLDLITLVGMSNVGKTYWSKKLVADAGFTHICCDDIIESELGDELLDLGYSGGIADMAKWLGQPYDPQFAANQSRYLQLEIDTMHTIIAELETGTLKGKVVIDTTGSVVHTNHRIRQKLRDLTTVVYLEATPEMREDMFKLYIAEPKPVVWGDIFQVAPGEDNQKALARCYPKLLEYRSRLYAEMADITLPRDVSLGLERVEAFLDYLQKH